AFLRGLVQKVLDQASTQTEAAQRLGVSQSYLNEFVGGTRGAGPKLLKGLAKLHPKLSGRLLGLTEGDDPVTRSSSDPRTPDERDRRPTLPAPARKPPHRRGTRKDTPAAKRAR